MKPIEKKIAIERMNILIRTAISNVKSNPHLATRQAMLARRISTRYRIPMPYPIKMTFCKHCKSFIVPGINSRVRVGRCYTKSIRVSCLLCGHTYRKIISQ